MRGQDRGEAINLNRHLRKILIILALIFSALLCMRFYSKQAQQGNTIGAAQMADSAGAVQGTGSAGAAQETDGMQIFGKRLSADHFQNLQWDEANIYATMLSYYNEKSNESKEYSNLHTWSQKGLTDGSYFVYAAYEVLLDGIDTPVPSLSWAYLQTDGDGSLYFSDVSGDELVQEMIQNVRSSQEGQELISLAQEAYDEAVESDESLAQYMENYRQQDIV